VEEDLGSNGEGSGWGEVRDDLMESGKAFVASFRSRDLGRAQIAFFAFELTEWGGLIALFVYAFQTGGTAAVGVIALFQQLPAAVVASFGSVLGDRYDRRRVLILVFVTFTTVTLAAGIAMLLDAPSPVAILLACSSGWVLTLVRPTYGALLPWIVRTPQELTTSYAANGLIESVSMFLGPILVGTVLAFAAGRSISGPGLAYTALGALLLLGTVLLWTTGTSNRTVDEEPADAFRLAELGAGYAYVMRDPRRRLLVGLVGIGSLELGAIDTVIVVLAIQVLKTGDAGVGFLNAALGVGAVIGAMVAMVSGQRARLFPSFRAGLMAGGAPLAVTAAAPFLAAPMLAVAGGGMQCLDITGRTMLQRLVPDEKLSRTYGVLESLYVGMEGVGAFAASLAVVWFGPLWTILVAGAFLPLAGLLARKRIASLDVGVRVPIAEMAVLRKTDLFAPLPPSALERVARNLIPIDVQPGSVVIREGDRGDRFYVVEHGTAVITQGGTTVADQGPGDYFGEVALLFDQPRNATVTATSYLRLLVLERDEFLRVVTGQDAVGSRARLVAEARSTQEEG
jgi:MFS family permease